MDFKLVAPYQAAGDQPRAIESLIRDLKTPKKYHTLLGVTGSGKTFTAANVIQALNKPTLVLSHNKTLVAQLYAEFRDLFPENAVEYFVSYYDYYQPEAYVPQTDTFIEKDSSINEDIDRLRLRATSSLLSRKDCIVVSSVSCIYGLGSPSDYAKLLLMLTVGETCDRDVVLKRLIDIRYERNDIDFKRGTFRVKGDTVDVFLAYEDRALRIVFNFDKIGKLELFDPLLGETLQHLESFAVYPAKHFVTTEDRIEECIRLATEELEARLSELRSQHKLLEAQRLEQRTRYDFEMMRAMGYCSGIENYSRYLTGRKTGERPYCLLDYFPKDLLVIIDESHVTLPQIHGMYHGDRARKETLVEYGFRLPSALDNRPLKYDEFDQMVSQEVFVSATPGAYEMEKSGKVIEQIARPTGLLDPEVEVRPSHGQVENVIEEVQMRADKGQRTLITTLTKRMSEDLTRYLQERGLKVRYMHSEIGAIERVEILKSLRKKDFDCLIGINLLREGLDLPEVSLVIILDADKEGFLRSRTALIQTAGRAARHIEGRVILYADKMTAAMSTMIRETLRRRKCQEAYNQKHGIIPRGIQKKIFEGIEQIKKIREEIVLETTGLDEEAFEKVEIISDLEAQMETAARNLHFEKAIELRDQIRELKAKFFQEEQKAEEKKSWKKKKKA